MIVERRSPRTGVSSGISFLVCIFWCVCSFYFGGNDLLGVSNWLPVWRVSFYINDFSAVSQNRGSRLGVMGKNEQIINHNGWMFLENASFGNRKLFFYIITLMMVLNQWGDLEYTFFTWRQESWLKLLNEYTKWRYKEIMPF